MNWKFLWWARGDLNPQGYLDQRILSPSRIPIPPLAHLSDCFILTYFFKKINKMEAPAGFEPAYTVLQTAA